VGPDVVLRNDHELTRNELVVLILIVLVITVAGVVLYQGGHNESFYSENEEVRGVFEALTNLGNDIIYLVVLCLIFISYDKRFGRRFFIVFFLAVAATDFLKELFHDPRPSNNLLRDNPSSGYGLPSGHTTTSISFYGYPILSHLDEVRMRRILVPLGGSILVIVPLSRMIIGAHDLQDVIGGTVVSMSLLVAYMMLIPRLSSTIATWSVERKVGTGIVGAIIIWATGVLILSIRRPDEVALAFEEMGRGGGLLLGCAIAFPLEESYFDWRPELMDRRTRALAAVIGLPIAIGIYGLMEGVVSRVLPDTIADLVIYSVLMLGLGLLVPFVLTRFLQRKEDKLTEQTV
jgi:membrane-associated phospholipid phosphatase